MNKTLLPLLALASLLGGCASITQGTNQVISFSIDPQEAKCAVVNKENGTLGTVSGKANLLQVSKGSGDLIANCTAEGYEQKTTRIVSSTQTAGVLGVAIDLGITDMLTGAMWKYPDHVSIVLDKTPAKSKK
ncbi:hypothetical protein ICN28_01665 [Polynucleobacter sp. 30F-ANTBAC]|uniref:hypothetical protein n=1 Tax=Polynucleobacter sp. 30F-ANTBAC TaxID=2689095 RepID=UPI001C0A96D1|nr:hypothetical protein [Polynucleobacter sp. 30F-ANTBAC]MBU3599222.1 hypothetical protein [Polynucleobacter sp. 30F-ANTBAC]